MTYRSVSWPSRFRLHGPCQLRHPRFDTRDSRFNSYQLSTLELFNRCSTGTLTLLTTLLTILRSILTHS